MMGFFPVEATLFTPEFHRSDEVIHHDPERFALAVRTLLYAWNHLDGIKRGILRQAAGTGARDRRGGQGAGRGDGSLRRSTLCGYMSSIRQALLGRDFRPPGLRDILEELSWENRDIAPSHFRHFKSAEIVEANDWNRSTAWDRVLGYFDPDSGSLKVHEKLLQKPARLREDLLIALGESLLGRYVESRRWLDQSGITGYGARCYEMRLRPDAERDCFLSDPQLQRYLSLARMEPDTRNALVHRITIGQKEGFLPPGLLFGLLYAWYLNNTYAATMEFEMSLLRWPPGALLPHQAKDRLRKQALVSFFRTEVFGHRAR
jgi:hypothetical protein